MTPEEEVEGLTRWASRSHAADRGRLLLALANVVASDDLSLRPRAQACLDAILPALALDADEQTRAELTARLADAPWAPAPLLASLAEGPADVARPLLARSPCLDAATLTRAVRTGTPEVQLTVARRAALPRPVIDALLERADPDALAALAANDRSELSAEQLTQLITASRHLPTLRLPLTRRAELTPDLAAALLPILGEASGHALARRFGLTETPATPAGPEAEQRLVDKLNQSGRLTPGFALRALRQGKQSLFEQAVAALAGEELQAVRAAVAEPDAAALEGICAAAGIDRCALRSVQARLHEVETAA